MGSREIETKTVDLIVVGGGPTGLLTALLCQRLGVSVVVIDAKPGPLALGRADALNARTQQYMEVVGVLDNLKAQGITCNSEWLDMVENPQSHTNSIEASSIFADGVFKSRQSHWWTSLKHVWQKNFLMIGQPVVEQVLSTEFGNSICYNESVSLISEMENAVEVLTDRGNIFRGKYCVAADGSRSMIRTSLNFGFAGTKPEMVWAVMDAFLDTDFPRCDEIVTFELDGQSRVSWIPRERNMARFYILLDGEITEEKCKTSIKQHMAPYRVDFVKVEWFSTFEVKERVASSFISKDGAGKVFLAGDAAHVHSVNGGQGLNTGVADAFALSWRLAHVLNNPGLAAKVKSNILNSYDIERRTVAQDVVGVAAKLVRDTVHEATQYVGSIEKRMGISYDKMHSPAIRESQRGLFTAGHPCPELYLIQSGQRSPRRLYSLVEYGKYLVLVVGTLDMIQPDLENSVSWFSIYPESAKARMLADGSGESYWADFVKENDNYVVVVRPDMYVGHVSVDNSWMEYLQTVLDVGLDVL
ncbi:hypothetical protein AK830_g7196 [Neonectria ditissima]|uniref:FAD-binding domain-containing protein n=1 Tax=Neonectria ditissima TaxID=78410 RepID=A0A0P7AXP9_9HYPO|nr:hypothetical protein AK830_g7196 [Neonectria ditissima]